MSHWTAKPLTAVLIVHQCITKTSREDLIAVFTSATRDIGTACALAPARPLPDSGSTMLEDSIDSSSERTGHRRRTPATICQVGGPL